MITGTEIYWITRMSYFQGAAMVIGIFSVVASAFWVVVSLVEYYDRSDSGPSMLKTSIPAFIFSLVILFGSLCVPNTKEMCAIKVLPVIINNENVQELPNKVVNLANEWLEELKPNKGE